MKAPNTDGGIPWWIYFTGGALAGWLAKGRVLWVAGAAVALYAMKAKKAKAAPIAAAQLPKAAMTAKTAATKGEPAAPASAVQTATQVPKTVFQGDLEKGLIDYGSLEGTKISEAGGRS